MPIYEYSCQKCGAHLEVMQKITDKPLARHAKCGGKLEKEWSRAGIQFKGSGWYVTDYAGKKTEAKEEAKPDSSTDSSETKKADAPESKTKGKGAESKTKESKPVSKKAPAGGD
ncbi:MAG TPA: FmdB family zinc ribbon protein [Pyrinomonadaceae bacterium]|nr:FmdB family zinc ribbon protein [Pyrinomonadaceae bacterium]